MDVPDATGLTIREQLLRLEKKTKVRPLALDEEPVVTAQERKFASFFWRLKQASSNEVNIAAINNWCTAYKTSISPIEVDFLLGMENVVRQELNKG